jgi:hypothetical protein
MELAAGWNRHCNLSVSQLAFSGSSPWARNKSFFMVLSLSTLYNSNGPSLQDGMIELNGEQIKSNGLDVTNLPGRLIHVATHGTMTGHGVATEMIHTSDDLSTPVKRESSIVGKTEIDKMGRILLGDVTIKG